MSRRIKIIPTGTRFGHLTVVSEGPRIGKAKETSSIVRCDCGTTKVVRNYSLRRGDAKSCGCMRGKGTLIHGESFTRLNNIWRGMRTRCNSSNPRNARWNGRGIRVCDEWNDFTAFKEWALTNGYADNLSIDRIDNNGDYEPSNCRWVSMAAQMGNRSICRIITAFGKTQHLEAWSRETGISPNTIALRLKRGVTPEDALNPKFRLSPIRKTRTAK